MALTAPGPEQRPLVYCQDCDDNHEAPECDLLGDSMLEAELMLQETDELESNS